MSASSPFNLTDRLQAAVELTNGIGQDKFPEFVTRVIRRLQGDDETTFEVLSEKLGLGLQPVDAVAVGDACTYILEQTAYYSFNLQVLAEHLRKLGFEEEKIVSIAAAWKAGGAAVLEKLRSSTLAPLALQSVDWRLHLQLAQASLSRLNVPTAMFRFAFADDTDPSKKQNTSDLLVEFSSEELAHFYAKLEKIQEQLDRLN